MVSQHEETTQSKETAADKTLDVLEALAAHSRIAEIASVTGLPRPTVHRILQTLVHHGFASSNGRGDYTGGPRILSLAGRFLQRLNLSGQVYPLLRQLQEGTGWTVHLSLLSAIELVVIAKVEGGGPYHLVTRVGMSLPLHCTSAGKAVLATMSDEEVRALLRRTGMPRRTPSTITMPDDLVAELAAVRQRGYAEDREEYEAGVHSVSAAIFDHTGQAVGAVSAATLVYRPDMGSAQERGELVVATARSVSESLGAPMDQIEHQLGGAPRPRTAQEPGQAQDAQGGIGTGPDTGADQEQASLRPSDWAAGPEGR